MNSGTNQFTGAGDQAAPEKLANRCWTARLRRIPPIFWVLGLTAACLLPFGNRPFFGDDTLFLRVAEQIQKHPADFFGFEMSWGHTRTPVTEVFCNPPLASYYLAGAATILGWSERALHLACLLPALAAAAGTFFLARRHCARPLLAASAGVATPVFLISGSTVMCDMQMLALWVWTLVWFERGLERGQWADFLVGGALAGLAFLTKFSALTLVPLLLAYGLARQRRLGWWLTAVLLPLLVVAGYEYLTWRLYGHGQLLQSAAYARRANASANFARQLTVGLSFLGGCCLTCLFYLPMFRSRRLFLAGLVAAAAAVVMVSQSAAFSPILQTQGHLQWGLALQATLFVAGGIGLLMFAGAELRAGVKQSCGKWSQPPPDSEGAQHESAPLLLGLWVLGVFVFAALLNWTVNGRSLLPITPALGILIARASRQPSPGWMTALPLLLAGTFSLWLLHADSNIARAERNTATSLYTSYEQAGRVIWFEGHGGYQYYLEKLGARALDMVHPEAKPGDVILIPNCAPGVSAPDPKVVRLLEVAKYLPNSWCSTVNPALGASFYEAVRGPLPFAFGPLKPDCFLVFAPIQPPSPF